MLDLRADVKKAQEREGQGRLERLAFRIWAWVMRHPRIYEMAGMAAASLAPESKNGYIRTAPPPMNMGPVRGWLSAPLRAQWNDLPAGTARSDRRMRSR